MPTCEFSSPDRSLLPCKLLVDTDTTLPPEVSVPITLSCSAQPDATVVFTPSPVFTERKGIVLPFAVLTIASGSTIMLVTNHCTYPVALLRGETLGYVQPVDHIDDLDLPDDTTCCHIATITPASQPSSSSAFDNAIDANLSPSHRRQLVALLDKFISSFDFQQPSLGRTTTISHTIDTGSHSPLRQRPYRVSAEERRVITEQVDDMLQRGVIQPSQSPWSSPVVLVKKKDGTI